MSTTSLDTELLEDGRILVLRLAAPPGNVLDRTLVVALREELRRAGGAAQLHAVLIEAKGDHFSYGASVEDHLPHKIGPFLKDFHGLFRDLIDLALPLVAVVHGWCLGGGLELAAFCQRVVAAPDTKLGQPEIELGVFAPVASLVLPWRIRGPVSEELLLTGRRVTAAEALALGLVDEVAADPRAAALAWIRGQLLPLSASSLHFAVRAARTHFHAAFLARLDEVERLYLEELMRTPDAIEGVQAFLEKRRPRFGA